MIEKETKSGEIKNLSLVQQRSMREIPFLQRQHRKTDHDTNG